MNISEVIADATNNGGGTYGVTSFDRHTGEFSYVKTFHEFGFYVSRPNGVENLPNIAFIPATLEAIALARHFRSGLYFGLWRDDNGNWSIDETEWFNDVHNAVTAGIKNNQRAIWDIEKGTEHKL